MKHHELKTDPATFAAVIAGTKTHEIRFDDRGFAVGDVLQLRETRASGYEMRAGAPLEYTGRTALREVSHIQTGYGLADGWVILSFNSGEATTGRRKEDMLPAGPLDWGMGEEPHRSVPAKSGTAVAQAAPEQAMPETQEPKYGIRGNRLYNRASGEFIPADEPVFIFRARDKLAVHAIAAYMRMLPQGEHRGAVAGRAGDFACFASDFPERMKQPDSALAAPSGAPKHELTTDQVADLINGMGLMSPVEYLRFLNGDGVEMFPHQIAAMCSLFTNLAAASTVQSAPVLPEPEAPEILEAISYHARERDDLTLEDAVKAFLFGWKEVRGRSKREMLLQLIDLMASAPAQTTPVQVDPVPCAHSDVTAGHSYVRCNTCSAIKTDGGWGIASRKWFPSMSAAHFYRKHGRMPE